MARLPDEQWAMIEDSIDKKRTAASAFKQRTHCGKGGRVKLPSDFMTEKERKAMNGKCETYRLNNPMSWDEFKSMPDDLKVTYINGIRERFGAPDKYIAEMFGISQGQFGLYLHDLKLEVNAKVEAWEKESFLAWTTGADTSLVKENEPETEVAESAKYERKPMKWEEFKTLSKPEKIAYIQWLRDTFGAPVKSIASMLGVTRTYLSQICTKLGCNAGSASAGSVRNWDSTEFDAWARGEAPVKIEELEVDILEEAVEDLKAGVPEFTTTSTDNEPIDIPYEDLYENPVLEPFAERPRDIPITELPYPERIEVRPEPVAATPKSGVMTFESRVDGALNMMAMVLGTCPVRMTITWERIEVGE